MNRALAQLINASSETAGFSAARMRAPVGSEERLAPRAIDALAARGDPALAFLRESWFASDAGLPLSITSHHASDGSLLAALPLRERSIFGLRLGELAGGYWPLRSAPVAPEATSTSLEPLFAEKIEQSLLRIGPSLADDRSSGLLCEAARRVGWSVIEASLGIVYELALPDPGMEPEWLSSKTRRKNRWRERRLSADGAVRIEKFTGSDWSSATRGAMATIERASWLASLGNGGDTKFADSDQRAFWEACARDRILADMLRGSVLWIGEIPAAFVFGIRSGETFYCIANNYDARFRKFGPGRLLLYSEFERARHAGIRRVSWGSGDAGYKTEMGATPGPALSDLLFVRNPLLALLLRPLWKRRESQK